VGIIVDKYRNGVNLGGWLSQCNYSKEHIASFITEDDIKKIAAMGLDHVRLTVDYPVLEDAPFCYNNDGFAIVQKLINWCKNFELNVVLDLHKTYGYFFDTPEDNILLTDKAAQDRFVALWQEFAKRIEGEGDNVVFELLNEIVDPNGEAWNNIADRAIAAIHEIDPRRYILLGGPFHNSPDGLDTLKIYDNEHILYNFHFYEPLLFTHQGASWTPLKDMKAYQSYPGRMVLDIGDDNNDDGKNSYPMADSHKYDSSGSHRDATQYDTPMYDYAYLEEQLTPAIDFAKRHNKELYCGEYGAILNAKPECRANYIKDVTDLFEKYKIGRAIWSYKGMSFGEDLGL